ncbi:MAG: hypothetical protein GC185_00830 [Alphaproteobacteria bacterium]|nr:hypothetical protein [Alphaproteobacteria bacterium]
MAKKAVNAAEYYASKQGQEKEYVRVYAARPVQPGELMTLDTALGIAVQQRARESGYELSAYESFSRSHKSYLAEKDFAASTEPAGKLPPAVPREEMTAEEQAALKPVAKGEQVFVNAVLPVLAKADYDGFILTTEDDKKVYLSNYELKAAFNNVAGAKNTHPDLVVRRTDEPALKGIVLTEDVTFKFKEGDYEAKAGSFLYPNADDVDGFTVTESQFAALGLRLAQPVAAPAVATSDDIKVKGPLKIKRKP